MGLDQIRGRMRGWRIGGLAPEGRGPLEYVRAIFTEPFMPTPEEVLAQSRERIEARQRAGLLRLILFSVMVVLAFPVIPAGLVSRASALFLLTLVGEFLLSAVCLVLNRAVNANLAGTLFVYATLALGLNFALRNPAGLDVQSVLMYDILSLVAVIAGLVLPAWVIWTVGGVLIAVTVPGVLLTPLSPHLRASGGAETILRLNAVAFLVACQALTTVFTWIYARSASAGLRGAVRAFERERELTALKDQFLIDANHELRTPIMAWYNSLELVLKLGDRASDEQRTRILTRALGSGTTVLRTLSTMLDPTIMDAGTPRVALKPVALAPLVRSVIETFDPLGIGEPGLERVAYASRALRLDLLDGVTVLADEERLRQILINLLTNALKYSEPGSALEVSVAVETPPRSRGLPPRPMPAAGDTRAGAEPDARDKVARIGVRDHGLGVPPRDVSKLFQRFVRLERDITGPVRGTGVGLYLCRVLVEAMGGRIWVESSGVPGEGSTFYFTLPVAED